MRLRLICFTLLLLLNACGEDKQPNPTQPAPAPVETTPPASATAEPSPPAPLKPETTESEATPVQQQDVMTSQVEEMSAAAANDSNSEGLALAKTSGCLACHAVDKKVVGPAWKDVAKRYAGDAGAKAKLIEKVAKGGRGNWTEIVGNMAMPPYSPRVSAENIEALVEFVLSLHNE